MSEPRRLPLTRGACEQPEGERPCPYLSCRYHLAVDIRKTSSDPIVVRELPDDAPTCALDVAADELERDTTEIALLMGLTPQRVGQIEREALAKLASNRIMRELV